MNGAVVVLEPLASGHRPFYVRWIARALAESGMTVCVVGGDDLGAHPEIAALETSQISVLQCPAPRLPHRRGMLNILVAQLAYYRWLRRALRMVAARREVDLVVVPYLDYCFHLMALLGAPFRQPWLGITMRARVPHAEQADAQSRLSSMLLRRLMRARGLVRLLAINPLFVPYAGTAAFQRLEYLPDPVDPPVMLARKVARTQLGIDERRHVVLVFGALDLRKGIAELFAGVLATAAPERWLILLVGRQSPELQAWLSAPARRTGGERVMVKPGYASIDVIWQALSACDVVWVGYPAHVGMSSVLVHAALAGRPTIVAAGTDIGRYVAGQHCGLVCEVGEPDAVATSLQQAIELEQTQPLIETARAAFERHSVAHSGRHLSTLIQCHLGTP